MTKNQAIAEISKLQEQLAALSDAIWDHPEIRYQEHFASKTLSDYLENHGFTLKRGIVGIPTAFCASFGQGHPIIGFLAEYDALPGMSQESMCDQKKPIQSGAPGHGCGHNLLGVGSVGAALAVKKYLEDGIPGTIRLFGCPAEEGGSGKTFMAGAGIFDDLDCALTWHPGDTNDVATGSNLANCEINYHFTGIAAHAAISPHLGRSALDAVELMNVGVQFLREHMEQECRIHYAITNAGGNSPNIVPANAEVLYLIRAPKLGQVRELRRRVDNIARGAAMMTETKLDIRFVKACSNVIPNRVLEEILYRNFKEIGPANYDESDFAFAKKMRHSMEHKDPYYKEMAEQVKDKKVRDWLLEDSDKAIYPKLFPLSEHETTSAASSDVGDVSWICPTAQISAVTMPGGTVMHSWQEVAVGKSPMAKKGMLTASRVLAGAAIDIINSPHTISQAKEELKRRAGAESYICPIPSGTPFPI